jgi:hypothetical protein
VIQSTAVLSCSLINLNKNLPVTAPSCHIRVTVCPTFKPLCRNHDALPCSGGLADVVPRAEFQDVTRTRQSLGDHGFPVLAREPTAAGTAHPSVQGQSFVFEPPLPFFFCNDPCRHASAPSITRRAAHL